MTGVQTCALPIFLGVLVDGKVKVKAVDGTEQEFDIHGGFISVANNRVSILGES